MSTNLVTIIYINIRDSRINLGNASKHRISKNTQCLGSTQICFKNNLSPEYLMVLFFDILINLTAFQIWYKPLTLYRK